MLTPEQSKTIWQYWRQASEFLDQKEYRKAIDEYTKAIKVAPIVEGFQRRGVCYNVINARQEALKDFQICLAYNVNVNQNLFHCGLAYRGMDQLEMALNCFARAVELDPGQAKYLYERGRTLAQLYRYQEALTDLEQVEKMDPENSFPDYAFMVGQLKKICQDELKKGNITERLEQAEELYQTANKEFHQGDEESAIDKYLQAIELNPLHLEAFNQLGWSLHRIGENEAAVRYISWPITLNYSDFGARLNRSAAYFYLGKYQEALEDAHMAVQIKPDNATAYLNRGNAYGDLGEPALAIADYSRAIELDPDDGYIYYNRAIELKKAGEYPKAIGDFDKAFELIETKSDLTSEFFFERGNCYSFLEDCEAAIKDYSKAIELDPQNQEAFRERGRNYLIQNLYQKALDDYKQAVKLDPTDAEAIFLRGGAFITLRRIKEGLADYKKASKLDPENKRYQETLNQTEELFKPKPGS